MGRRAAIPATVDSVYFKNVSPLWVAPGRAPIDRRYHDAVQFLAEWAGPKWSSNEHTNFFMIRMCVIATCESWRDHDWNTDAAVIRDKRIGFRQRPKLMKVINEFQGILHEVPFAEFKLDFGRLILHSHIGAGLNCDISNGEAIEEIDRLVENLARIASRPTGIRCRFGCVEYDSIPKSLPDPEIAVALSIADRITFFRRDGEQGGTLWCPHPPKLSRNLPWKAIAAFASANASSDQQIVSESNVQTRVANLATKVSSVHWTKA